MVDAGAQWRDRAHSADRTGRNDGRIEDPDPGGSVPGAVILRHAPKVGTRGRERRLQIERASVRTRSRAWRCKVRITAQVMSCAFH